MRRIQGRPEVSNQTVDFQQFFVRCTCRTRTTRWTKTDCRTAIWKAHNRPAIYFVIQQIQESIATGNAHKTTRSGHAKPAVRQLARLPLPRKKARYGPASAPIVSDQVTAQQHLNNKTTSVKCCPSWLVPTASHRSSYDLSKPTM